MRSSLIFNIKAAFADAQTQNATITAQEQSVERRLKSLILNKRRFIRFKMSLNTRTQHDMATAPSHSAPSGPKNDIMKFIP
jgi:hypothetical protein